MIEGNSAADLRRWCAEQDPPWLGPSRWWRPTSPRAIGAASPPTSSTPSGWPIPSTSCGSPTVVVDKVRRRVQNETLGHRGRKADPLYRIRKLLLTGSERLDERGHERMLLGLRRGDPHDELLGAWLAKESVRDVYLTEHVGEARTLLDKAIVGCQSDEVAEIRSLGDTLERWQTEILNHHRTGASNGPTEGLNLCVKRIKRAGRGFACFEHYRLRVSSMRVASPGPGAHHRPGSEPALPTSTCRAPHPTMRSRKVLWLSNARTPISSSVRTASP